MNVLDPLRCLLAIAVLSLVGQAVGIIPDAMGVEQLNQELTPTRPPLKLSMDILTHIWTV